MTTYVGQSGVVGGRNVTDPTIRPPQTHAPKAQALQTIRIGCTAYLSPVRPARREIVRVTFCSTEETAAGQCRQSLQVFGATYVSELDVFAQTGANSSVSRDVVVDNLSGLQIPLGFSASVGETQIASVEFLDGTGLPLSTPVTPTIGIPADGTKRARYYTQPAPTSTPGVDDATVPALVRIEAGVNIDFENGTGAPYPGGPVDNWSGVWEWYQLLANGAYQYNITALDDGARFYVDGVEAVTFKAGVQTPAWVAQAPTDYLAPFTIAGAGPGPGGAHLFRVEYFERTGGSSMHVATSLVSSPPPPPPPPGGALRMGVYVGHSAAADVQFGVDTGKETTSVLTYASTQAAMSDLDTLPDYIFGSGGFTGWLQSSPGHVLIYSVPLLTNPNAGDFFNTALDVHHQRLASAVHALGIDSQIIIRFWEMNGNWNPYGRQYDEAAGRAYGVGFKAMWQRIVPQYRSRCSSLINWCPVITPPFETGDGGFYQNYYPGDNPLYKPDIVGFDIYDRYGANDLSWVDAICTFGEGHGTYLEIDELGLDDQGGDDAAWLTGVLNRSAAHHFLSVNEFETRDATELPLRSGSVPNSWAAWRAFWAGH